MGDGAGLRLNPQRDNDIITDLSKYRSKTDRIKEVYRKVLALERQGIAQENNIEVPKPKEHSSNVIVWHFPKEPTV